MGVGLLEFHQLDRMVGSGRAAARPLLEQAGGDLLGRLGAATRTPEAAEGQRFRFSRGFWLITIGVPTKPNSSRSRRSMNRS